VTAAGLVVLSAGMMTGVGLSAPASCAAIRSGLNNFNETRFVGADGEWIIGSEVPLSQPWRGVTKLAKMAASSIDECLNSSTLPPLASIPVVLNVAEDDRPGRIDDMGERLLSEIQEELGIALHEDSSIVSAGRVGGAIAMLRAAKLVHERHHSHVIVAGADSYLMAATLAAFEERGRLLTGDNSDGFIPGEAAAAVLVSGSDERSDVALLCSGLGFAREISTIESQVPFRADGMVNAVRAALDAAGVTMSQIDYRIGDLSGEQYRFKEIALAVTRLLRERRAGLGLWHPADCIGEIGAAALPVILGVLLLGARKHYLPGSVFLGHLSNDDDKRAALIIAATEAADGK
jgi:3-oxoacyl-[acyl-carrier-protein] synthase I